MKQFLTLLALVACISFVGAQPTDTCHIVPSGVHRFGGTTPEQSYGILPNPSGYIFWGTCSGVTDTVPNGDISVGIGGPDMWLVQINHAGTILWQQAYGSANGLESGTLVEPAPDGGYYLAMTTKGSNVDAVENHGVNPNTQDILLIRIDSLGNRLWVHCFGTVDNEEVRDMEVTASGDVLLTGYQWYDSQPGETQTYSIKVGSDGTLQDGPYMYDAPGILALSGVEAVGDAYYFAGYGDHLPGMPFPGSGDMFVEKTDTNFNRIWIKFYAGTSAETVSTLNYENGKLLLVGITHSTNGPFGNVDGTFKQQQITVLLLDTAGTVLHGNSFGGMSGEFPSTVRYNPYTDGYIVYGYSMSRELPGFHSESGSDCIVVWTDSTLAPVQQELFGGTGNESQGYYYGPSSLVPLDGDTIAFITSSNSLDGMCEGSVPRGSYDMTIVIASASAWQCPEDTTIVEPTSLIEQFYHPEVRSDEPLEVYTMMGALVATSKDPYFDAAIIPAGMYLLRQGNRYKKFLKMQ